MCWERTSEREYVISSPLSFLLLPWWLRISFVRSQTCPIINQHRWKPSFFPVRLMWGFAFRLWSASAESGFRTMFCMLLSNNYLKTNCNAKLKWNLRGFFSVQTRTLSCACEGRETEGGEVGLAQKCFGADLWKLLPQERLVGSLVPVYVVMVMAKNTYNTISLVSL